MLASIMPVVYALDASKLYSDYSDEAGPVSIGGGGGGGGGGGVTLNAPGNITVAELAGTNPRLRITWDDTNSGNATYSIERKLTSGGTYQTLVSSTSSSTYDDPPTDVALFPEGTNYTYQVCATKIGSTSQCSTGVGGTRVHVTLVEPITSIRVFRATQAIDSDLFLCTRNDCPGDSTNTTGNQHRFTANAYDKNGTQLSAGITWTWTIDPGSATYIKDLTNVRTEVNTYDITANNTGAGASLLISAELKDGARTISKLERRIPFTVQVCDNPWPSTMRTSDSPYSNAQLDFSMWYCTGATSGLSLGNPIQIQYRQENIDFDYEYLFPVNGQSDVITVRVRVAASPYTFDIAKWYQDTFTSTPSMRTPIDGYPAVQDATGIYVLAYDTSSESTALTSYLRSSVGIPKPDTTGPLIYYFTTNTGAQPATKAILGELLKNIKFSKSSATSGAALRRDVKRIIDFEQFSSALTTYNLQKGTYPKIESGSFKKNSTISAWQTSWGSLMTDLDMSPIDDPALQALNVDHFSGATQCSATGYEPSSCWNAGTKQFGSSLGFNNSVKTAISSNGVYAYSYEYKTGNVYEICTRFERLYTSGLSQLYCINNQTTQSISLTPPAPAVTLTIKGSAAATINPPESPLLAWSVVGADSIVITNDTFVWNTSTGLLPTGSAAVYPTTDTTYKLTATNNNGQGRTEKTVSVTINDTTRPVVAITDPSSDGTSLDGSSATITASASDNVGVTKVELLIDDGYQKDANATGQNTYSATFDPSDFSTGTHTIKVKAYDAKNNSSLASRTIQTVHRNAIPTVSITSPANNTQFSTNDTVVIKASATDSDGTINRVSIYNDYDASPAIQQDYTAPYEFNLGKLAVDSYTYRVIAYDNLGAASDIQRINISVVAPPPSTINDPPTINYFQISPTSKTTFAKGEFFRIDAGTSDSNGIDRIELYRNNVKIDEIANQNIGVGQNLYTAGTYSYYISVYDTLGAMTQSSTRTVTISP